MNPNRSHILLVLLIPGMAAAQSGRIPSSAVDASVDGLIASLSTPSRYVYPGQPVWVDFRISNADDGPRRVAVPGATPLQAGPEIALPLSHVFSGAGFAALIIETANGQGWDLPLGYQPSSSAEVFTLGPRGGIGVTLNATDYYPALRTPGLYRLRWRPYGGSLESNELTIEVATPKQAIIQTDQGTLIVRLFHGETPNHVRNFIELARQGFYDNLLLHRLVPGYYVQGGCPNGDGTGIRPDGLKLEAELTDRPIERGSVCMARVEGDLNSASCQFLICNTRVPQWDGQYTVFGELVGEDSFQTLDAIMRTPADATGKPQKKLFTRSVRIVDAPIDTLSSGM